MLRGETTDALPRHPVAALVTCPCNQSQLPFDRPVLTSPRPRSTLHQV